MTQSCYNNIVISCYPTVRWFRLFNLKLFLLLFDLPSRLSMFVLSVQMIFQNEKADADNLLICGWWLMIGSYL